MHAAAFSTVCAWGFLCVFSIWTAFPKPLEHFLWQKDMPTLNLILLESFRVLYWADLGAIPPENQADFLLLTNEILNFKSLAGQDWITVPSAPVQIVTVPLVEMKSCKKWAHNCGASMLENKQKNLKKKSKEDIWFDFFLFKVKLPLSFFLLSLSFQQSQEKVPVFWVSCPLVVMF